MQYAKTCGFNKYTGEKGDHKFVLNLEDDAARANWGYEHCYLRYVANSKKC